MTDLVVGVCLQTLPCCLPPPRAPPLFSPLTPSHHFNDAKPHTKTSHRLLLLAAPGALIRLN